MGARSRALTGRSRTTPAGKRPGQRASMGTRNPALREHDLAPGEPAVRAVPPVLVTAVVGEHHEQGVVGEALAIEGVDELAECCVEVEDGGAHGGEAVVVAAGLGVEGEHVGGGLEGLVRRVEGQVGEPRAVVGRLPGDSRAAPPGRSPWSCACRSARGGRSRCGSSPRPGDRKATRRALARARSTRRRPRRRRAPGSCAARRGRRSRRRSRARWGGRRARCRGATCRRRPWRTRGGGSGRRGWARPGPSRAARRC